MARICAVMAALVLAAICAPGVAGAADEEAGKAYYVSPEGKATNPGTQDAPWDITSALNGSHKPEPGATIYIAGGTYKNPDRSLGSKGYSVKLVGTKEKPIVVRPTAGARATIDGGIHIDAPTTYLWVRDVEIMVSETTRKTTKSGSFPGDDLARPWGGLEIYSGTGCKYINLVIHDNGQGCGFWNGAQDSEIYGCLIYNNGWIGPDRGHGHCIYSQNQTGTKTIADNILSTLYPGTYTMHAYGSARAHVDNYHIIGNVAYNSGPFLIGGGRPSQDIVAEQNMLYKTSMQIGYSAKGNKGGKALDNVVWRGGITINQYVSGEARGNLIVAGGLNTGSSPDVKVADNTILAKPPADPKVILRPNKYESNRANLAICNWHKAATVEVDGGDFLKDAAQVWLMDPKDFFGEPVHKLTCKDGKIEVPMKDEFAVYVVLKRTATAVERQ